MTMGLPSGEGTAGSTGGATPSGGGSFQLGEWLVPIVLVMLPTAGVGVVGAWLSSE
jgi:hypothetical protein